MPLVGLLWVVTGFSAGVFASNKWYVRAWRTDDGLVNNNVRAVVQGRDNYLWVVPSVGLMRFDGVKFSRFPIEDFAGMINNHVSSVLYGRSGVLWILMYSGTVYGLNPDFSVVSIPQSRLLPEWPYMAESGDGSLVLGYPSGICRVKDGQVTRFGAKQGVPSGGFHGIVNDGAGNVWLAKGSQLGIFRSWKFEPVAKLSDVRRLTATHTNAIWFLSGSNLVACDTKGKMQDFGALPGLPAPQVSAMFEDHTGALWIGTYADGLYRFDRSHLEKVAAFHLRVLSITEDREGDIWAGINGDGLYQVSLRRVRQEVMENDAPLDEVRSVCEDTNGRLWGASVAGQLISRTNGVWKLVLTNAWFNGIVRCVAGDGKGGIWIGTKDRQLLRLFGTNYTTWEQNLRQPINALLPALNGDLWILGDNELHDLHGRELKRIALPRRVARISAIAEDASGDLWIGGHGVVLEYKGGRFIDESPRLPISGRNVCCIYGASDGGVWISCGGLGLLRLKDGKVSQIRIEQGLPNNYIAQIVPDGCGWLWFGSDIGIFKIQERELEEAAKDPDTHLHPVTFRGNEGLPNLEALFSTSAPFVLPRAICTRDGRVWLFTHKALISADPRLFPENYPSPRVLLTQVAMDGKTIASYGVISNQMIANLETLKGPLRLPPSYHHLEFDFTAFCFSEPKNICFRYQLAGFDHDWIDAGAERNANYSSLSAGNYQFRVEASIGGGPWTESPATLAFIVTPFFWQTSWFRLVMLALFTAAIIAIVRYISFRRLHARMRLLEQHAALDKERTRISRDLHDELGSSLNYISMSLGDLGRTGEIRTEEFQTRLGKIAQFAVCTVRSLDEIVWAVNPRNDSLRSLVEYATQFAAELFEDRNIRCRFRIADNLPQLQLTPETRHHLFLAVKEALGNALVHAHPTEVQLAVNTAGTCVEIFIRDNGAGFNRQAVEANGGCNGLRNMRQRMEAIGGRLAIETEPGKGTTVRLIVPVPAGNESNNPGISI